MTCRNMDVFGVDTHIAGVGDDMFKGIFGHHSLRLL